MLTHPTLETLKSLKLHGMIQALEEQQQTPAIQALSFEERIALIVDRERLYRDSQRRTRLLRGAHLKVSEACVEDINYKAARGLDKRHLLFVGEVPKNLSCVAVNRSRRRPESKVKGQRGDRVVRESPAFQEQPWVQVKLSRQTLGPQVWEVKAAHVWQRQDQEWSERTYWLIWARNVATGEEKYFLSNAPADATLSTLMAVAFYRWTVEHSFQIEKSELGFTHYEGRNYTGLMRQQTLCLLMLTFVAGHTERLRGEKTAGDEGAGLQCVEPAEPGMAGEAAGEHSPPAQAGHHRLPAAAESSRRRIPPGTPPTKRAA